MSDIKLCVNIDHVATVRQARGGIEPDPLEAARIVEENGAAGVTVHLREDRRHIQDSDVVALRDIVVGTLNLEMALSDEIIDFALNIVPDQITLVPEKRQELTTEGGLDVKSNFNRIKTAIDLFHKKKIIVSLFIEPDLETVELSKKCGADYIEIHTGTYCNEFFRGTERVRHERERIYLAAEKAVSSGIGVNAGHGLDCRNLPSLLDAPGLDELNIGFSIIARSVFIGLPAAVREMLDTIRGSKS
ncbi:MAG TPA: pyridoxine 5'-phosphate synthase [Spirochaetota bacterium]|nr:pyridoxine 5'-phosphate synthase [Spirochaetota bacterium]HPI89268.1 pyridoxine 5'-phosphate synthase [Spirochaetota bacterium]HPR48572.1 pyridoxine 5'-phosphate synthase [Spirochaetota bacterium]